MAAPLCRRDWTAGSVLEPTAAVDLERPAHVRGPRRESPARVRVGNGDKPVTYEEALTPHHIPHRKCWLSLRTGNLDGEDHAAERTMEDVFLRKFMLGTLPGCLAACLKRRANQVDICALVLRLLPHTSSTSSWTTARPCSTFTSVVCICTSKLCPQRSCMSTSRIVAFWP